MTYLNQLAQEIHGISKSKGYWQQADRNPAEVLMLIVSEAAEALEEVRDGRPLNEARGSWVSGPNFGDRLRHGSHTIESRPGGPHVLVETFAGHERRTPMTDDMWLELGYRRKPEGVPSELADIIIRVLDACAAWDIDIEAAIREKIIYNAGREHLHGRAAG